MLEIKAVISQSIADQLNLEAGDCLLAINGVPIIDQVDYQLYAQGEEFVFDVQKKNGELWEVEFDRDEDDPIGLEFAYPQPRQCANNCQFCFVRQLPQGLRETLYVRDDDYRFSYLYGAYITLTNLSKKDIQRIIEQNLSPLYISIHATDAAMRSNLLGRDLPSVLPLVKKLIEAGIKLHTQIVLCPGQNDADCLTATVNDLVTLSPGILSLAVVPVGLTKYRDNLPPLRCFTSEEAVVVLAQIHALQDEYRSLYGTRFVFAADEFYLQAGLDFPNIASYEELALLENGVGLIPLFRRDVAEVLIEAGCCAGVSATLITGESAAAELQSFIHRFNQVTSANLSVQVVHNDFFGSNVTVAGLIVGGDVIKQLQNVDLGDVLLVPDVMCREGEDIFIDDVSLEQIANALDTDVVKVPATAWGILEFVEFMAAQSVS